MTTIEIQKPVKLSAFKNLMAHVTSTALTLTPAPFLYGAGVGTETLFQNDYNFFGFIAGALTGIIGLVQLTFIGMKFSEGENEGGIVSLNTKFWKRKYFSQIENEQKESVDKTILAIRHLTAVDKNYEPSITDHRAIASLLLSSHLDDLAFTLWGHSIVKEGGYDSSRNFKEITQISALYAHAHEIAKRMNPETLDAMQREMIKTQVSVLQSEDLFAHFHLVDVKLFGTMDKAQLEQSDALKLSHQINDAVYRRASFFLEQEIITSFTSKNYDVFKEVIKASSTIDPSIALEPLLKFLNNHPSFVDWNKMIGIMNENFKGDISIYQQAMKKFQENKSVYQQDYELNAVRSEAELSAKAFLTTKNSSTAEKSTLNSDLLSNDRNQEVSGMKLLGEQPHFEACIFVSHSPDHFKDKWDEMQTQYALIARHSDKIAPNKISDLNHALNSCLPLLITIDRQLSHFPHMNPEQKKKLLSDNLDLAVTQVKNVVNEIDDTFTKELQVTKKYQTMKVNG